MDADYIRDLFAPFRPVTVRRMFGGAGVYAEGVMFALLAGGTLYLKSGETNVADFDQENLPPFSYQAKSGKRAVMSFRKMPERLFDEPDELAQWAHRALAEAHRKAVPRSNAALHGRQNERFAGPGQALIRTGRSKKAGR